MRPRIRSKHREAAYVQGTELVNRLHISIKEQTSIKLQRFSLRGKASPTPAPALCKEERGRTRRGRHSVWNEEILCEISKSSWIITSSFFFVSPPPWKICFIITIIIVIISFLFYAPDFIPLTVHSPTVPHPIRPLLLFATISSAISRESSLRKQFETYSFCFIRGMGGKVLFLLCCFK